MLWHLLLWSLGKRTHVRVRGQSMSPSYCEGDEVLVDPGAYRRRRPREGDVVLARHPYRRDLHLIKRVASVTPGQRYVLRGDNPDSLESTDSRAFGPVDLSAIEGRVVASL